MSESEKKSGGVSLRVLYLLLIVLTVLVATVLLVTTLFLARYYRDMEKVTNEYIEMEKAASDLMDASDYLTECAQRFTLEGGVEFYNRYFEEANVTRRREKAVEKLQSYPELKSAADRLQAALDGSRSLMEREFYAMKLVVLAKDYVGVGSELRDVVISVEDRTMDADKKMSKATQMLLDEEYFHEKDQIRKEMRESLNELEKTTKALENKSSSKLQTGLVVFRIVIVLQFLAIVTMVWLTSSLGINPVLKAVEKIRDDSPIPEVGANEFKYLARTYNRMYAIYKRSLEHLNFKASHDELTGAYNRAGYELLMSGIDLPTTYMLILDVDNFKSINDTYGHEAGNKVLVKLVDLAKQVFRADDYICRVGGDEFVIVMGRIQESQRQLIIPKILEINDQLAKPEEGMPACSISVGLAHGSMAENVTDLFEKADKALYVSKRSGKHTYTFFED